MDQHIISCKDVPKNYATTIPKGRKTPLESLYRNQNENYTFKNTGLL